MNTSFIAKHLNLQCDNCLEKAIFEIVLKEIDVVLCSKCLTELKGKVREIGKGGGKNDS